MQSKKLGLLFYQSVSSVNFLPFTPAFNRVREGQPSHNTIIRTYFKEGISLEGVINAIGGGSGRSQMSGTVVMDCVVIFNLATILESTYFRFRSLQPN